MNKPLTPFQIQQLKELTCPAQDAWIPIGVAANLIVKKLQPKGGAK